MDPHFTASYCGLLLFELCRAAPALRIISLCVVVMCECIFEQFTFRIKEAAFSNVQVHSNITVASVKTVNHL